MHTGHVTGGPESTIAHPNYPVHMYTIDVYRYTDMYTIYIYIYICSNMCVLWAVEPEPTKRKHAFGLTMWLSTWVLSVQS